MTPIDPMTPRRRDVTRQLGFWLRRAEASVWRDLVRKFQPFDIKPQHYAILVHVDGHADARLEGIGRALHVHPSNLVAFVEELVTRGLVSRAKAPGDRRVNTLALTPAGEALLARLAERDDAHERALADLLGEARMQALIEDLVKLAALRSEETAEVPAARDRTAAGRAR